MKERAGIQSVEVGFTLLEAVNYLEHYGLLRSRVGTGEHERWERVEPRHSWNSNNIATNVLLYHLQRHSDHHANPTRRYQSLRDFEESPVLPTGYAGMIVLARGVTEGAHVDAATPHDVAITAAIHRFVGASASVSGSRQDRKSVV